MKTHDIQYLLKAQEFSFAKLARALSVSRSAVSQVCDTEADMQRTSPRIEQLVCAVIGLPLHQVFPKRWNPDGTRIKDRRWIKERSAKQAHELLINMQKHLAQRKAA